MRVFLVSFLAGAALLAPGVTARLALAAPSAGPTHLLTIKFFRGPGPQGFFALNRAASATNGLGSVSVHVVAAGVTSLHHCRLGPCFYQIPAGASVRLKGYPVRGVKWGWWDVGTPGKQQQQRFVRILRFVMDTRYTVTGWFEPNPAPPKNLVDCRVTTDPTCLSRALQAAPFAVAPSIPVSRLTGLSLDRVQVTPPGLQTLDLPDAVYFTYGTNMIIPSGAAGQPVWVIVRESGTPRAIGTPPCSPTTRVTRIHQRLFHPWGPWSVYTYLQNHKVQTQIITNLRYGKVRPLVCAISSV